MALRRAVRAACHCVRTRCSACSVCCSTVLTGTGWIPPHRFASSNAFGVRSVGLVATDVRAHILRRQQPHGEPVRHAPSAPVVRHPTGFHHHRRPGRKRIDEVAQIGDASIACAR